MKRLMILAIVAICAGVALSLPADASQTVAVTVNGSTVILTQGVLMTVGGVGSGASTSVDIGNIIVTPNGSVSVSGNLSVNGQTLPLTTRVLSSTPGGDLQYAVDGGTTIPLGTLGQITAQPFGGVVKPGSSMIRVPVTAALTWQAVPAPEPGVGLCLSLGLVGTGALIARRCLIPL